MEDFNYIQKYWYKDKAIYQNCGIDSDMVGEYNGFSIFQQIGDSDDYKEVLHATLTGCKPMTIEEMKQKIINYEKLNKEVFSQIADDEENEEDF